MKSSNSNPQNSSPLINVAIVTVLLLAVLPIVLFAIIQINPPFSTADSRSTNAVIDTPKRQTAAARRTPNRLSA